MPEVKPDPPAEPPESIPSDSRDHATPGGLPEDRGQHDTENRESHPNASGPEGLEGEMGLSSERSRPFEGEEGTGSHESAQGTTDGEMPTYTDEPLVAEPVEGPHGVEDNTAEVRSHPSDPEDHPGHSHG